MKAMIETAALCICFGIAFWKRALPRLVYTHVYPHRSFSATQRRWSGTIARILYDTVFSFSMVIQ
jgi:cytochrome b561